MVICENGAKALAWEITARRATPEFFARHSVTVLSRQSDYWLEQQGRITHPLIYDRDSDHYVPIEWDKAFAMIGNELRALSDPSQVEFYPPADRATRRRSYINCSRESLGRITSRTVPTICHEPTSQGLPPAIGVGKGTCTLEDFNPADLIFVIGQNPGNQQPSDDDRVA